jgi:putative ABC transport system permease protein
MTTLRLALLDLVRKKTSTGIALISISICVACGGLLLRLSILSGSRFVTLVKGPNAVIGAKAGGIEMLLGSLNLEGPYPEFIPGQLNQTMRHRVQFDDGSSYDPSAIQRLVPIVILGRYFSYRVLGTDENFFVQPHTSDAPELLRGEWFGPGGEVVVGSEIAQTEGIDVGDTLAITAWTSAHRDIPSVIHLRVVGVFKAGASAWNRACFTSLAEAQRVFSNSSSTLQSSSVFCPLHYLLAYIRPGGFGSVEALVNRRSVAELISVPQQKAILERLTGTGIRLGLLMTFLVLLLAGLSVAGVMISRFDAMKIQIAVLRALGFSKSEIATWLLWEGTILGVLACIIGALIDLVSFPFIRNLLGSALPSAEVAPSHFYYSAPFWLATILGTTIAVLVPFLQISRQDTHTSLKGL